MPDGGKAPEVPDRHDLLLPFIKLGVQTLYSEMPSRMSVWQLERRNESMKAHI